jgi:hypothetical protein
MNSKSGFIDEMMAIMGVLPHNQSLLVRDIHPQVKIKPSPVCSIRGGKKNGNT